MTGEQRLVALVLATLASAGCASAFLCPGKGGPRWRELATSHFTLATDLPAEAAREALTDLEDFRAMLIATAWPGVPAPPGRVRVVIVDRERDWRAFEQTRDGYYTEALFQPLIAMRAGDSDHTRRRIRHELTHHLSRSFVKGQPAWLAEGLATLFETLVYDRARGEALIGLAQAAHLALLAQPGPLKVAQTLDGTLQELDRPAFYATSWLLVHYLVSRQGEALARYLRALDQGIEPAAAWGQSFGDLSPQALQAELRGYLRTGSALVVSRRFRAPAPAMRERPLPDADVHALRALLFLRVGAGPAKPAARALARGELAEALRLDPDNLLAHGLRAFALEEPVPLAAAQVLAARQPDSWLAWAVLYRAAGNDLTNPEARRAAVSALRLAAAEPAVNLPFGPSRSLFHGPGPALRSCPRDPRPARDRPREAPACRSGRALSPEEALAELRAVATSDVSWCFFDLVTWEPFTVALEIDEQGRPQTVCPEDGPPGRDRLTGCLERALAGLSFPALPGCPRWRLFQLAPAKQGQVQVFGASR